MRLVAAVFSDVHSAQPYVSTVSDQSLLTPLLTLGEFRVVVERSVPAHLHAGSTAAVGAVDPAATVGPSFLHYLRRRRRLCF